MDEKTPEGSLSIGLKYSLLAPKNGHRAIKNFGSERLPVVGNNFKAKLQYVRAGGGDSGGGGSGVSINGQLRLKDFANCSSLNLSAQPSAITGEVLAPSIFKLDAASVLSMIRASSQVSDTLLEKIIFAAAARANWYAVRASLQLDQDQDFKLAVFKRPIGVILDQSLLAKLSAVDQRGLLFHETLRMVSLGFNIALSTSEIEEITCKAFSSQEIEISRYPALVSYMEKLIDSESSDVKRFRKQMWEITFESISQLKDLQAIPMGGIRTFFYQLESSKFETLRIAAPQLDTVQLEKSFFGWAALEAPKSCRSKEACHYFEEWPGAASKTIPLLRWNLIFNDSSKMGWESQDGVLFFVTKNEVEAAKSENFCREISAEMSSDFKSIEAQSISAFSQNKELALIINRNNLTTMEDEGLPLLARTAQGHLLWTPRSDLEQGFTVINEDWNQMGRVICIRK